MRCGGLALLFTLFGANKRSAAAGCEILLSNLEDDVLNCLCQPHDPDQPYVATASLLTVSDDRVRWTNDVQTLLYCTVRVVRIRCTSARLRSTAVESSRVESSQALPTGNCTVRRGIFYFPGPITSRRWRFSSENSKKVELLVPNWKSVREL